MKAVLYSINRPHTDNIKSGLKLWEIRKSKPNIPVPFPAFIYETKRSGGCGKVIGEFICNEIRQYSSDGIKYYTKIAEASCVSKCDLLRYKGKNEYLYGLHISNLKIYDKPKELSEFNGYCKYQGMTKECLREDGEFCNYSYEYITVVHHIKCEKVLTRPPQSMCYVEVEN